MMAPPTMSTPQKQIGTPANYGRNTWVQTERKAHEQWAALTVRRPRAAAIMHLLVANMGHQNAVVISQKTLAKMSGYHVNTVARALSDLEDDHWIQIVQIGASGTVNAYVVNSNVAWGESRDQMHRLSVFHATVVADAAEQPEGRIGRDDLRKLPIIYPPEEALPHGEGEPGAQMLLPGLEPVIVGTPRPVPE